MKKIMLAAMGALAVAMSACTENEKVLNHATGEYYAITPHSYDEDWQPLFNQ